MRPTFLVRAYGRTNKTHQPRPKMVNLRAHTVMGKAEHPLPPAFELVRRCLTERVGSGSGSGSSGSTGLTTKELHDAGMSLERPRDLSPEEIQMGEHSKRLIEQRTAEEAKFPRKDGERPLFSVSSLVSTHPFVSTTFLKKRVLSVLESQGLIRKVLREPRSSPPTFEWQLTTLPGDPQPSSTPGEPSTPTVSQEQTERTWRRLIEGEGPAYIWADLKRQKDKISKIYQEERFEQGKDRRTHEQIRQWDDRAPGITTTRERDHLNKRRARVRPEKERQRYGSVADVGLRAGPRSGSSFGGGSGRAPFGLRRQSAE